jgi:dTDP-4-dehydrorhamnose 3,5-epimerase
MIPKKKINYLKIFKLYPFKDFRGKYIESFNSKKVNIKFVQDDFSYSKKNILRGFHGDNKTWKLFTCISGKVQFGFINYNKKSKNFKKNYSFILSENSNKQILVPPKFGTAHLVLSKRAIIHYKQSTHYGKHNQFTIHYKSGCINFNWKSKKIIVSKRDKNGILIS